MAVDPTTFRAVLGHWPSGVAIVTTTLEDTWFGMTASSFSSVSLDPPLVSVCIARTAPSHDRMLAAGVFAVNILGKDHVELGKQFAGARTGAQRFDGVACTASVTGAPVLDDAVGWVDCRIAAAHEAGDHTIFIGEVLEARLPRPTAPLLYHSRAWGQLADVLPEHALVIDRDQDPQPPDAADADGSTRRAVLDGAFTRPDTIDRVASAVAAGADQICLAGSATPLQVRRTLQDVVGRTGSAAVVLALDSCGPLDLANVLTALKSGVRAFEVGNGSGLIAAADVALLLDAMGIAQSNAAVDAPPPLVEVR